MAKKSQNSYISVSTAAAAADNITAITAANPPVVTAASHGISNGAIVAIASVGGMVELNDRAFVAANVATNTVELKGEDGSGYTAYTSGGTMIAHTMTEVGEVTRVGGFDGTAAEIDVTHLRSRAKEFLQGLQDFGNVTLSLNLKTDTGQARLRALKATQTKGTFSITDSDGLVAAFHAYVTQFSFDAGGSDTAITAQATLRVTNEPAWFA